MSTEDLAPPGVLRLGVPVEVVTFDAAREPDRSREPLLISVRLRRARSPGSWRSAGRWAPPGQVPETARYLSEVIEELKANGFVADALRRAGQAEDLVAPA